MTKQENSMEKIDIVEKLNDEVEEQRIEIKKLERKLDHLKDFNTNRWQHHKSVKLKEDDSRKELPLPRFEMIYSIEDYQIEWVYGLALKPFWFLFENEPDYLFIPFSRTTSSGDDRTNLEAQNSFLPFRDRLHIKHDSMVLGLPMYFTHLNKNESVEIENDQKDHILRIIKDDKEKNSM
jgi:uncharacterized coiled-coil protein SlyX